MGLKWVFLVHDIRLELLVLVSRGNVGNDTHQSDLISLFEKVSRQEAYGLMIHANKAVSICWDSQVPWKADIL